MSTISLEVKIPGDFLPLQHQSSAVLTQQVQLWVALHLFQEYQFPLADAADLAGLSVQDFMTEVEAQQSLLPSLTSPAEEDNPLLQLIGIADGEPMAQNIDDILYGEESA